MKNILHKRLHDYKRALFLYRLSLCLPSYWFSTSRGFCYYFLPVLMEECYPELCSLVPADKFLGTGYWFEPGKLKPRIALLKKAIKLTEDKLLLEL